MSITLPPFPPGLSRGPRYKIPTPPPQREEWTYCWPLILACAVALLWSWL